MGVGRRRRAGLLAVSERGCGRPRRVQPGRDGCASEGCDEALAADRAAAEGDSERRGRGRVRRPGRCDRRRPGGVRRQHRARRRLHGRGRAPRGRRAAARLRPPNAEISVPAASGQRSSSTATSGACSAEMRPSTRSGSGQSRRRATRPGGRRAAGRRRGLSPTADRACLRPSSSARGLDDVPLGLGIASDDPNERLRELDEALPALPQPGRLRRRRRDRRPRRRRPRPRYGSGTSARRCG